MLWLYACYWMSAGFSKTLVLLFVCALFCVVVVAVLRHLTAYLSPWINHRWQPWQQVAVWSHLMAKWQINRTKGEHPCHFAKYGPLKKCANQNLQFSVSFGLIFGCCHLLLLFDSFSVCCGIYDMNKDCDKDLLWMWAR